MPKGKDEIKYGVGDWSDTYGNHRVVVQVASSEAGAVRVHVPWRRRDIDPDHKAVWVMPAANEGRIKNVACPSLATESGDIVFEPTAGAGTYYCYYRPFDTEGSQYSPSIIYHEQEDSAAPDWKAKHGLDKAGLDSGKWRSLPQARVVELQAINDFHRCDPMELPATAAEMDAFLDLIKDVPFILFPEDRRNPIRMPDAIPVRWLRMTPQQRRSFSGEAQRGEYYTCQVGVFAHVQDLYGVQVTFADLKGEKDASIPASAFTCFNTGGTDCRGQSLVKQVDVPKGLVQSLWCGVQIPEGAQPGTYKGKILVRARNLPKQAVGLTINVADTVIANAGDDALWRHARLRWLNSTIGLDDEVFAPYEEVQRKDSTVEVLGRQLRFGDTGLPESIVSTFGYSIDSTDAPPREVLAGPMRLVVKSNNKTISDWRTGKITSSRPGTGAAAWTATSHSDGFELTCRARMGCDGYVDYRLTLKATEAAGVEDIVLEIPFRGDTARYMLGLGSEVVRCPQGFTRDWDWKQGERRGDNQFWLGDVNAGLYCRLKHTTPHWSIYGNQDVGMYRDWSGDGKGGCSIRTDGDVVTVRVYTGSMNVEAGRELQFNIGMLITPARTLNKEHWNWRYYHSHHAKPVSGIADTGAKIINLHQGGGRLGLNPYINYPFSTVDKLAAYAKEAHEAGMKVKLYYTVRELSNYAEEFWALRSLGDEIFSHLPRGAKITDEGLNLKHARTPRKGSSWLMEHVIYNYVPMWHEPLGNGHYDAALMTQGQSRWHNYYLEGLDYLVKHVGIHGIYLDGIGYDREILMRVRKVLQRARPGSLIDFHSGNMYGREDVGKNSSTALYMELYPWIDSLWFGEGYDYNRSPEYWLFEISGIPYGLFGEMLQGGGNPWRGMLYGMTARPGWTHSPEVQGIWKLWDDFGIAEAKMTGYWDPACPVRTGRDDILATVYVREGKTLIALASWAEEETVCKLEIDFVAIGLTPDNAILRALPIEGIQLGARFEPGDEIPVKPGKGWLLVVEKEATTEM